MISFIKKYPQLLLFGILTAMFSGPGQTFLISFFIPHMRDEFGMTKAGIAGIYSAATLISAFLLPIMGRLLDRIRLVWFTLIAGFFLAAGCLILSRSAGIITILIGFLLVRNLGQGTLALVSSTTMARVFGAMRGKALGIANMGYPLGEASFPIIISAWISVYGWRSGWMFLAGLILLFFSPLIFLLIKNDPHEKAHADFSKTLQGREKVYERKLGVESRKLEREISESIHWSALEVLKDVKFYFLVIPILITPCFLTALFFHQNSFIEWKGWDIQTVSVAFIAFAVARAFMSFVSGPLADKFGAKKIFPFVLLPLAAGILSFLVGRENFWVFVYLAGAGLTIGCGMTVGGALWAELYGTKHLGSIRGMISALIVFSTAAAPFVVGILLDASVNPKNILLGMLFFILVGVLFAWGALYRSKE